MKKKIEQLLNGKFEYEQPQLLFSKEKISLTMKAGETKRGEVYVGTEDNQKIRGYVTSSSRRVVPGMDHISGTTVRLPLGIDTVGLAPGENLKGWLCFTTNIGEARLPFEIEIEKEEIRSFSGVVGNLDEFVKGCASLINKVALCRTTKIRTYIPVDQPEAIESFSHSGFEKAAFLKEEYGKIDVCMMDYFV